MTGPFNPYIEQMRRQESRDDIARALRNLQVLAVVNFVALLWILYVLGGR